MMDEQDNISSFSNSPSKNSIRVASPMPPHTFPVVPTSYEFNLNPVRMQELTKAVMDSKCTSTFPD